MSGRLLGALVGSVLVVVVMAAVASAGSKVDVTGTYSVDPFTGTFDCAPVGASGFMWRCDVKGLVSQYSGDLTGIAVADFTSLINCKTGREVGHGTETFTGQLGPGPVGSLSWIDQFSADVDCANNFAPSNLDINSVAVKGSGAFAGLQGKLHFGDFDYSGTLH